MNINVIYVMTACIVYVYRAVMCTGMWINVRIYYIWSNETNPVHEISKTSKRIRLTKLY